MLWLAAYFPHLGLEVCPPEAGETRRPRVLIRENRVVLRNQTAVEAGIATGATLATAHGIASNLQHFQQDAQLEARRLRLLAEMLYQFSSEVSLQPPDAIVIEVSGSLNLFGHLDALEERVARLLDELGHRVCLRTARTPLAALALARAEPLGIDTLGAVPLSSSELDARLIERFANLGIRTLGPLFKLPADELAQRFGPGLTDYLQRLKGDAPDPRECITPTPAFDSSVHLLEPMPDKAALLMPMQRLLAELEHWLTARQFGTAHLAWYFLARPVTHERSADEQSADEASADEASADEASTDERPGHKQSADEQSRNQSGNSGHRQKRNEMALAVRFATPRQNREAFLEISRMRLERIELPEDVLTVRLRVSRPVPWQGASRALFEPLSRQVAGPVTELIDQLNARLGVNACIGVRETCQHGPERAWQATAPRLAERRSDSGRPADFEPDSGPDFGRVQESHRPLWLFASPRRISRQTLTLLRGPERIQTGWWLTGDQNLCRDYYVARHANGACCWAFVDIDQRWYLHGYFG